jgi:hypothetical protein
MSYDKYTKEYTISSFLFFFGFLQFAKVKKPNHESSVSKLIYDPLSIMHVGSTSTNLANLWKIVGG